MPSSIPVWLGVYLPLALIVTLCFVLPARHLFTKSDHHRDPW